MKNINIAEGCICVEDEVLVIEEMSAKDLQAGLKDVLNLVINQVQEKYDAYID